MDIATISSLITSLKAATDIAKFIRESDVSLERAELKLKLADLVEALANAKMDAASVQQEILDRDQTIRELREAAKIRGQMRWVQPCYYKINEQGVDEPFCQKCFDADEKLSRLHTDGKGYFRCRVCDRRYKTTERAAADKARQDAALHAPRRSPWA